MMTHRITGGRGARLRRVLALASLTLLALGTLGCEDATGPTEPVATVQITAPVASFAAGDSLALQTTLRSADGQILTGRTVSWTSSDTTVARVRASGVVLAVAPGQVTISATAEGRTGTTALTVTARPAPAPVLQWLMPASAFAGETDISVDVVGTGFTEASVVLWNGVARPATRTGELHLRIALETGDLAAPGTATVEVLTPAPGGGRSTALTFTIVPRPAPTKRLIITPDAPAVIVGASVDLAVGFIDLAGTPLPARPLATWWSDDPRVATVVGGRVTGVAGGQVRIHAQAEGLTASVLVRVKAPPTGNIVMYQAIQPPNRNQIVDTIQWSAGQGPGVPAHLVVRAVRLELNHTNNTYVQEFRAAVMVNGLEWGTTGWMERGDWSYDFLMGTIRFAPAGGGATFTASPGALFGLVVTQKVRRAAVADTFVYEHVEVTTTGS